MALGRANLQRASIVNGSTVCQRAGCWATRRGEIACGVATNGQPSSISHLTSALTSESDFKMPMQLNPHGHPSASGRRASCVPSTPALTSQGWNEVSFTKMRRKAPLSRCSIRWWQRRFRRPKPSMRLCLAFLRSQNKQPVSRGDPSCRRVSGSRLAIKRLTLGCGLMTKRPAAVRHFSSKRRSAKSFVTCHPPARS